MDIARRHRRVVDNDPGRLDARPSRGGADVVNGGGGNLREGGNIVEEGDETTAHDPTRRCRVALDSSKSIMGKV